MACACGDINRCPRCFETFWRAQIAAMTQDELLRLYKKLRQGRAAE